MTLYFKELEKVFIKWHKLHNIKKPIDSAASVISHRRMIKFAKEDFLKSTLKLLKNIEEYHIKLIPTSRFGGGDIYIKVDKKKIQSKL